MGELERLAARLVLEDSLLDFTKYFFKARFGFPFIENWHHGAICEHLQAVELGQIRNLIVNLPPGGTKTELVSINWPARAIARNSLSRFLMLSYADELVALNSQTARNIVQSEEYQELWPMMVANDSKAKKRWNVMEGDKVRGGIYAATPHAQVTGFRAGYMGGDFNGAIILDDPMKASDAESEVRRKEINSNIARTIRSRRAKPDVPIVVVQQRLHENDTTGWLTDGELGEEFELLKIPALDGSGKSYWEIKEPTEQLKKFQAAQPYIFSSQYMQEPAPEEGNFFKRDMFEFYDELPEHVHKYGASDYAVSDGEGDYTVHGVLALDEKEDMYLCDLWRGQTMSDVWVEKMLDMAHHHQPLAWAEEKGQIIKSLSPYIRKRMMERNIYLNRVQFASASDKKTRARPIQARMSVRKLRLPRNAPWVQEFIRELLVFDNGKNDDQVDIMSLFGRMLMGLRPGQAPKDDNLSTARTMPTFEEMRQRNIRARNSD